MRWKIKKEDVIHRLLHDLSFQGSVSLYLSLIVNLAYAVFKLVSAWWYSSVWMGAIAIYYIVLCGIRGGLVWREWKGSTMPPETRDNFEWQTYFACGWTLLILNVVMTGVVVQMIRQGQHYSYPGFIIYGSALYAFYALTAAIRNAVKYRKIHRPILSATKGVSLCKALMSLMALQTAMVSQFSGNGDEAFAFWINTFTGTAVCLLTFAIALYMIWRGNGQRRGKELL